MMEFHLGPVKLKVATPPMLPKTRDCTRKHHLKALDREFWLLEVRRDA
jgi:hypothetical protein